MIIFFTHSHKFKLYKNNYYTTGGFLTPSTIQRYSYYATKLIIGARIDSVGQKEILNLSKLEPVDVEFVNVEYNKKIFERIKDYVIIADVVIARLPSIFGILAVYYSKKYNKRIMVEVVGNAFEALWYHSFIGKLLAFPFQFLTKVSVKKADFVSYITEEYLQEIYPTHGHSENSLVNVELKINNTDNILTERFAKIKQKGKKIRIGMIGNYTVKYKGHYDLLKIFSKIVKEYNNIELELVGGGDKTSLQRFIRNQKIEKNVKLIGTIPSENINNWFDTIDVYVQPSKTEAQGRSVIEAMSRGCTVVTSDVGGMKELIQQEFRFPKNNLDKFYFILTNLIANDNIRKEQAERNYEYAKKFSKEIIDNKRTNFFKKVFE